MRCGLLELEKNTNTFIYVGGEGKVGGGGFNGGGDGGVRAVFGRKGGGGGGGSDIRVVGDGLDYRLMVAGGGGGGGDSKVGGYGGGECGGDSILPDNTGSFGGTQKRWWLVESYRGEFFSCGREEW